MSQLSQAIFGSQTVTSQTYTQELDDSTFALLTSPQDDSVYGLLFPRKPFLKTIGMVSLSDLLINNFIYFIPKISIPVSQYTHTCFVILHLHCQISTLVILSSQISIITLQSEILTEPGFKLKVVVISSIVSIHDSMHSNQQPHPPLLLPNQ